MSYRRLERLPTDPDALAPVLARAVERRRDALPATFDAAEARAYALFELIRDSFEAPTSPALRAALYDLAATTPGIRLAGATTDAAGRAGTAVDVVLGDARFVLVVDPRSGALLETRRILLRASAQFPGLAPGLLSRATYVDAGAVPSGPGREIGSGTVKVLCIDGGGIRGLIPALVLAEIERRTGRRIADMVDLIAGTSTGGILAAGLARPGDDGRPRFSAEELAGHLRRGGPGASSTGACSSACSASAAGSTSATRTTG